eukprot:NODE_1010_length_2248_cov_0.591438.p1 type:complete len:191 gc:universal NODE_1010_length_2248_cov_0.591438:853-1425(+)
MGRRRRLTNVQEGFEELEELQSRLKNICLELVEIEGDGNCLMRALSLHLDMDQYALRETLVNYILENAIDFEPFIAENQTIEKYCSNMKKNAVYGGNLELYACCMKFSLIILVHQLNHPIIVIQSDNPLQIIHVAYVSWQHYSGIRVKQSTCKFEYCNLIGICATKRMHRLKGLQGIQKAVEYFMGIQHV